MKKTTSKLFVVPYMLWIVSLCLAPLVLIFGQSFFNIEGQFQFKNYKSYFCVTKLDLPQNEFQLSSLCRNCDLCDLDLSAIRQPFFDPSQAPSTLAYADYPANLDQFLLLKAYAFIGIFGQNGSINQFLEFIGIGPQQLLFTDFSFIFVASYIELPFMILPIFNVLDDMDNNLINASYDLGATKWETFRHVIFPLSMNGVRSGVQSVFIPSLSLFMLTRLIGGNRVITFGDSH